MPHTEGDYDYDVVGYWRGNKWMDVENGAPPPTPDDLAKSEELVIHATDSDGNDIYFTRWDEEGFDSEEIDLDALVDDSMSFYTAGE